jgi:CheY-like chemotaxis protein
MPDGPQTLALLRRRDDAAAAGMPDLILLDLSLAHTDGSALLAELKGDSALRHIPVVVLPARSSAAPA